MDEIKEEILLFFSRFQWLFDKECVWRGGRPHLHSDNSKRIYLFAIVSNKSFCKLRMDTFQILITNEVCSNTNLPLVFFFPPLNYNWLKRMASISGYTFPSSSRQMMFCSFFKGPRYESFDTQEQPSERRVARGTFNRFLFVKVG